MNSFLNEFLKYKVRKLPGRRMHYNEIVFPHPRRKGFTNKTMRASIEIVMWAWKRELRFLTEVPMLEGSRRADVVIPELHGSQVIEIFDTEPYESILAKKQDYEALGVSFLAVPADPVKAIEMICKANNIKQ